MRDVNDGRETAKVRKKEPKEDEIVLRRGSDSVGVKMVERGDW